MPGPDEKSLPWVEPTQSRDESSPGEDDHFCAPANGITWHLKVIIIVPIILLNLYLLSKPVSQIQWIRNIFIHQPIQVSSRPIHMSPHRAASDGKSSAMPNDRVLDWKPVSAPELSQVMEVDKQGFLHRVDAEVFCKFYNSEIWEDRSRRRRIYELIYVDPNTPTEALLVAEALGVHIGLRYNSVDYFVIAESKETFDSLLPKPLWLNPENREQWYWEELWPYHDKMIYHNVKPESSRMSVLNTPQEDSLVIERSNHVECERRTEVGDDIAVEYTALFEDGTLIGSSHDTLWSSPIAFTLGTSYIRGWNEGLKDMCVGEKRILTMSPSLAYGSNDTGLIPGNSTLTFETELVGIKAVSNTWRHCYGHHLTKDPLSVVRKGFAYNAMYSQVIPHLSGVQAIAPGDVLLIAEWDQIPSATSLAFLRNCAFPGRFSLTSSESGFLWRGVGQTKTSHHVATFFNGPDTVLPQALRSQNYFSLSSSQRESQVGQEIIGSEYCGACYGTGSPANECYPGCCNSCSDVERAYAALPWAVGSAYEHVEQCVRERRPFDRRIGF